MVRKFPVKPDDIADQVAKWPFQIESHHTTGILRMKVSIGISGFSCLRKLCAGKSFVRSSHSRLSEEKSFTFEVTTNRRVTIAELVLKGAVRTK